MEAGAGEVEAARERLAAAGAAPEELAACGDDLDALVDLSIDLGVRGGAHPAALREVAARAGIATSRAEALLRSAGLRSDDVDRRDWFDTDTGWLAAVDAALEVFGDDGVDALVRRAGAAAEQLAHASAAVFRVRTSEAIDWRTRPLEAIERNLAVAGLVEQYLLAFDHLYRHHVRRALRPDSVAAGRLGELRDLCVGFVDVASSTALAETLDAAELAGLVASFEEVAVDAAVARGVRVVKTIGDEVMLCGDGAVDVCEAALDLVGWCSEHATFSAARGGVCRGPLLDQGGDCYGPVVNRAARFAQAAPDGAVLVDEAVAREVRRHLAAVERPGVAHRGLGLVRWWEVTAPER